MSNKSTVKADRVKQHIDQRGFEIGEQVLVLFKRNGEVYWVNDYQVFDPYELVSTSTKGNTLIEWVIDPDCLPLMFSNSINYKRPFTCHLNRIRKIDEDNPIKTYKFIEVFG